MDKLEFVNKRVKEIFDMCIAFSQAEFETYNRIRHTLFMLIKKKDESGIDIAMVNVEGAFSKDADFRTMILSKIMKELNPLIAVLVNEGWMVRLDKDAGDDLDSIIRPSLDPRRVDAAVISVCTPYFNKMHSYEIKSDFLDINEEGEPKRTLGEQLNTDLGEGASVRSFFDEIYAESKMDPEEAEKFLTKVVLKQTEKLS